ncbi:MAG: hypothetical protein M3442_20225 [Chloroflexota bacterium]|nr:hypothetical protein [Chloroflexota bacterium]
MRARPHPVRRRRERVQDMRPVRVPAFRQIHPHIALKPNLRAGNIQE